MPGPDGPARSRSRHGAEAHTVSLLYNTSFAERGGSMQRMRTNMTFGGHVVTSLGVLLLVRVGLALGAPDLRETAQINAQLTADSVTLTMSTDGYGLTTPLRDTVVARDVPVAIWAQPDDGFMFEAWEVVSGTVTIEDSTAARTTVTLGSDAEVRATFGPSTPVYFLTLGVNDEAMGSVDPGFTTTVGTGVTLTITAIPRDGYEFLGWTIVSGTPAIGDSLADSTSLTMGESDATIRATFALAAGMSTLKVHVRRADTVDSLVHDTVVAGGDSVHVTAPALDGFSFIAWRAFAGGVAFADSLEPVASFEAADSAMEIVAVYELEAAARQRAAVASARLELKVRQGAGGPRLVLVVPSGNLSVTVLLMDLNGRMLGTVVDRRLSAGTYAFDLAMRKGVSLCVVRGGGGRDVMQVVH